MAVQSVAVTWFCLNHCILKFDTCMEQLSCWYIYLLPIINFPNKSNCLKSFLVIFGTLTTFKTKQYQFIYILYFFSLIVCLCFYSINTIILLLFFVLLIEYCSSAIDWSLLLVVFFNLPLSLPFTFSPVTAYEVVARVFCAWVTKFFRKTLHIFLFLWYY